MSRESLLRFICTKYILWTFVFTALLLDADGAPS